jgi:hypothetical protein
MTSTTALLLDNVGVEFRTTLQQTALPRNLAQLERALDDLEAHVMLTHNKMKENSREAIEEEIAQLETDKQRKLALLDRCGVAFTEWDNSLSTCIERYGHAELN